MKILITAFEPFGNEDINSTLEAIKYLPTQIDSKKIKTAILPVVFNECYVKLQGIIGKAEYDVIICLGQNSRADKINVERVAINIMDARIPDNNDNKPIDEMIIPDGPEAYFATLPIKDMVAASNKKGTPAQVSNTAGTFVCNNIMYHLLNMTLGNNVQAGFIHIPQTPLQAVNNNSPSMDAQLVAGGITAMLTVL